MGQTPHSTELYKIIMLSSILTASTATSKFRSWTVRIWVDSCCTDQAEFTCF